MRHHVRRRFGRQCLLNVRVLYHGTGPWSAPVQVTDPFRRLNRRPGRCRRARVGSTLRRDQSRDLQELPYYGVQYLSALLTDRQLDGDKELLAGPNEFKAVSVP